MKNFKDKIGNIPDKAIVGLYFGGLGIAATSLVLNNIKGAINANKYIDEIIDKNNIAIGEVSKNAKDL